MNVMYVNDFSDFAWNVSTTVLHCHKRRCLGNASDKADWNLEVHIPHGDVSIVICE